MTTLLLSLFFACGEKEEEVDTSTEEVVETASEETETEEEAGDTATSEGQ